MRRALAVFAILTCAGCSANYYLGKGRKLADKRQYTDAAFYFRRAIEIDPRSGEAYYQLALTEIRWNHQREALQDLVRAAVLLTGRDDVKVTLGDLAFNSYVADPARPKAFHDIIAGLADGFLAKNQKSYDGLRWKGYLAAVDQKLQDAEEFFRLANTVKPMQPELILSWVHVLFQDHRQAEAEGLARQLIAAHSRYVPIYDELFAQYTRLKKSAEAENILKAKVSNNPADGEAPLQLALFYAELGREIGMRGVLQRMLDQPAVFPHAHLQAGDFYNRIRRWNDAVHEYEQGAKASPKERIVYLKRIANVWLAQGKGERAWEAVSEIRRQVPSDDEAQAVQASLLLANGKPEEILKGVALFRILVNKEPDNVVWRFNFGRALAAQGEALAARQEFLAAAERRADYVPPRLALAQQSQVEGDYHSALKYANEILAVEPGLPAVRLLRVVSLISLGSFAQARGELVNLEKILPEEAQLQFAMLDLKEKKFKRAEDEFRKLLQANPDNPRAISGLVQSEAAQNELQKARLLLRQELTRLPSSETVGLLLGDLEVAIGNLDSAIVQYQQLVAKKPQSAQFHLSLGRAYQLKGDLSNALAELGEAGRLAPKDPLPPALLAHAMITSGHMREAIKNLRHALQLSPGNTALKNDLAYLLAETGENLDEALVLAQDAVRGAPGEPELADTLAWVYFKKDMNDSALQIFRDLAQKYPDKANFRFHLGMTLRRAREEEAAKREFNVALSLNPPAEMRRQIEAVLSVHH